ncbi:MAG: ferrous iron transport protein A [Phycisphaerales bacterium]|nr:ferrous iron transport protein A [Phycisphaerales bacterium]
MDGSETVACTPAVPLTACRAPDIVVVREVGHDGRDGVRLKRMGICEGRRIQLIHDGDPMILRVVGSRIGVSRRLAATILVTVCPECHGEPNP